MGEIAGGIGCFFFSLAAITTQHRHIAERNRRVRRNLCEKRCM
jgi:hypothetical protein